jgi:excisionase family DNA binding protein
MGSFGDAGRDACRVLSYSPIDRGNDRQGFPHDPLKWLCLGTSLFLPAPVRRAHRRGDRTYRTKLTCPTSFASRQKRLRGRRLRGHSRKVNTMSPDQLVFTVPEAAKLLRISQAHAYALVSSGELPNLRLGRRILIPRWGLESLIAQSSGVPEAGTAELRAHGRLPGIRSRHRAS